MSRLWVVVVLTSLLVASASPIVTAQIGQPDIVQEHWYHSYATLTLDLDEWADDYPEIVILFFSLINLKFLDFLLLLKSF